MRRSQITLLAAILLWLFAGAGRSATEIGLPRVQPPGVIIEDFTYLDTSGEPTDQATAHQERLQAFMTTLRRDVEADGRYHLVAPDAQGDAKIRIVGAIQKLSTLVQWARVAAVDIRTNKPFFEKLYTFRGDNDEAWSRAEAFVSRDIVAMLADASPVSPAAAAAPIELAVFDFELEDTTAAALTTGIAASDAAHLADVTNGVRELLAQSGRYRVIDISGASADAIKTHTLRDCGGCDAAIALKLGADQSLIGVVRRVSRTEYTVGFQLRDARTGAVVSRGDSGLRMGTDYSWSRGAVRLISDRLLERQAHQ